MALVVGGSLAAPLDRLHASKVASGTIRDSDLKLFIIVLHSERVRFDWVVGAALLKPIDFGNVRVAVLV